MRPFFGYLILIGLFMFLLWRAHNDGALRAALQGMLYGSIFAAAVALAMWLIMGGHK